MKFQQKIWRANLQLALIPVAPLFAFIHTIARPDYDPPLIPMIMVWIGLPLILVRNYFWEKTTPAAELGGSKLTVFRLGHSNFEANIANVTKVLQPSDTLLWIYTTSEVIYVPTSRFQQEEVDRLANIVEKRIRADA